jgi:hypothetical protein
MKIEMAHQFFLKFSNIKFYLNRFSCFRVVSCVRTDGQTARRAGRSSYFNRRSAGFRTRLETFDLLLTNRPTDCQRPVSTLSKENYFADCGSLGCDVMWSCRWFPTFRRNIPPQSTLKMEALATTYKIARRHNPEDHNRHLHRPENLTPENYF